MKGEHHLAVCLVVAAGSYAITRSVPLVASFIAAGVLVDLDHWLDYWTEYGARLDVRHFVTAVSRKAFRRAILVLHAWEGVLLAAWATYRSDWHPVWAGITLGWGLHLVLDQLTNYPRTWTYSLIWRALGRFHYKRAFPKPPDPLEEKP